MMPPTSTPIPTLFGILHKVGARTGSYVRMQIDSGVLDCSIGFIGALVLLTSCASTPKALEAATPKTVQLVSSEPGSGLPPGWRLMKSDDVSRGDVRFDFNGDGISDLLGFVVNKSGKPALFVELSRNQRAELYLLSTELGFSRLEFDPKKKNIILSWDSGSSSFGESFEARFRFQEGDFFLIGATKEESTYGDICTASQSCGSDVYDFNYLTGEVQESIGGTKSRTKRKKAALINLKTFKFEMIFP